MTPLLIALLLSMCRIVTWDWRKGTRALRLIERTSCRWRDGGGPVSGLGRRILKYIKFVVNILNVKRKETNLDYINGQGSQQRVIVSFEYRYLHLHMLVWIISRIGVVLEATWTNGIARYHTFKIEWISEIQRPENWYVLPALAVGGLGAVLLVCLREALGTSLVTTWCQFWRRPLSDGWEEKWRISGLCFLLTGLHLDGKGVRNRSMRMCWQVLINVDMVSQLLSSA